MATNRLMSIDEFYANKNIFITGVTGFIGKVLIEKLLRSCPEIQGVYCLVRPKRGKSGTERIKQLFEEMLYDKLRESQPEFLSKIHLVPGDVMEDNLGVSEEDRQLLADKIDIVFHSAATIKFDEAIRVAVNMNVLGVRKMVQLCKTMKHLEVFVHVSTAYANCDRTYIEEKVYPPPMPYQKLIDVMDWMDDDMLKTITPRLLGKFPNTYTLTKQLAENLLIQEGEGLPTVIVRPSIVTAIWKEPIPGWVDNWNGPSGLYIAVGKGILRSYEADGTSKADMVPVDLPVNMLIVAAWHTAVTKPRETLVYHSTTGNANPLTWGQMEPIVMNFFKRNPLDDCFRRPNCSITTSWMVQKYYFLFSHLLPAYLTDFCYKLLGKKPRMVQIYKKLHKSIDTMNYFTKRSWEWTNANSALLRGAMSPDDVKNFYFDPRPMDWQSYLENYCMGTRKYVLKEDICNIPAARDHVRKLRNIRYMFNTAILVMLWRLLIAKSSLARKSWMFVMGLVFKFVRFFRITSTLSR